jgi:hypothetical protein
MEAVGAKVAGASAAAGGGGVFFLWQPAASKSVSVAARAALLHIVRLEIIRVLFFVLVLILETCTAM